MKAPVRGIEVLFEDDHLIAVVKPAGLPTANAAQGEASVFTALKRRFGQAAFVGIVSRLDAPVSGVVVIAKTPTAAASLAEQFRERTVDKAYAAVVTGRFPAPLGTWIEWHDAISRHPGERASEIHPAAAAREDGGDGVPRVALSKARVTRRAGEVSLVELEPATGRRHQLRVQLASRGCPIVGDRLYGSRLPCRTGGLALHAVRLTITHPATGKRMTFESPCESVWKDVFPSLFRGRAGS
ncbi:MAG: RluA family pseudouridine synthase [Planctomycetia bacterium]|nr:RluA family pseudouridine synthase [Planctomycetia bacterium]